MLEVPKLTTDLLVELAGAVLSLLAFYVPPFRRWMESRIGEWKFLFMAGVLLLVAAGYTLLYCRLVIACIQGNLESMVWVWVFALVANQGTYKAIVQPAKKEEAKQTEISRLKWG